MTYTQRETGAPGVTPAGPEARGHRSPGPRARRGARRALGVIGRVAFVCAAPALRAQEPDSTRRAAEATRFQMPELSVQATRPLATVSGASAVRLDLESPRVGPVPLLEEALRDIPFVQVRENSRGEAQLTLRGTESRQVAVLVDGIPLTLGWDARSDLSVIPVDAAREVELYRGISSVLHGPNVLGGVVAIEIGRRDADPDLSLSGLQAGVDATGATVYGGRIGSRWGVGEGTISLQSGFGRRTRDAVPLPGGVVQPAGETEDRLNSDLSHSSVFLTSRYEAGSGAWVSLSAFGFDAAKGVPPELHVADPRLWRIPETNRFMTAVSAGTAWGETPFGTGDFEVSLGVDVGETRIDAFESLAYETIEGQELADDRTLTARVLSDHEVGPGVFRSAFTWSETRHVERIDAEPESVFRQRLVSLGGEIEMPLASAGRGFWSDVRASGGLSLDRGTTPETGGRLERDPITDWGARLGASAHLGGTTRLHLGASRRVRFPSLRELYSGALGRFEPNPDLAPETLRAFETGLTGTAMALGGQLEAQAVLFHQRLSDAIVRTGLGDGRFRRENRRQVRAAGLELLGTVQWGRVALGGDLTWQDVVLTDAAAPAGSRAEYQPEIAGSVSLAGPLVGGLTGRAAVEVVGRQFCVDPDGPGDLALDRSGRLDLMLSRDWDVGGPFRTLQATASLDNVTDATVFDQCGLPRPGRLFRLQLRIF
ncbi:MAG: TonB-dependent receptor [Gemmatimonadetes bacterium]|nr:TonB-dependent receptor [Gemmatimonadota bacterium]